MSTARISTLCLFALLLVAGPSFVAARTRHTEVSLDAEDLAPLTTGEDSFKEFDSVASRSLLQVYPPTYPAPADATAPVPPENAEPVPEGASPPPARPVENVKAPSPVERKVRATMSAQTEQAATAIASGVNDFAATLPGGGFPYTPAADFFSRKLLLTSDEVKTMIENVLRKAVANSAATKAKLADFVRDGLSFNMDLLLEYPETTSAQEMDEDAAKTDQITRAVSESIAELPASLKDSFNAEVTATVVEEAKYVAAARTSDMRDIIATINTAAAQTTNFGNAIDTYLGGGRGVASLFAGVVQNAIYSGLDNTTVPGFGIVEGNRTESTQYRIKLRLTYSDVSSEVMDETSRKVYSIVDDAMKADTRRKLLAPDVFEAACGGTVTSSCIFDGATYLGLEAEGFSGAAAVRAWLSGVVLAIVAIMLIA